MRRSRVFGIAVLVLSLIAGLTVGYPPEPVAAEPSSSDGSVPVQSLASKVAPLPEMPKHVARPVVWPTAGSAVVQLPVVAGRRATASAQVGGLPLVLSPVPVDGVTGQVPASPLTVKVDLLDQATARKAGVPLALRLSRADGGSGPAKVNVRLDYNGFRDAYGGAWAARLGLRQVPECGMSAVPPDAALRGECVGVALPTVNDFKSGLVSADVDLAAPLKTLSPKALSERERALVGIEATEPEASTSAASGSSFVVLASSGMADGVGTFNKTDLKASYAWNAGTNAGNFTFSYPMSTPPVPGGLAPQLGLDYSSQAVDGQTAGENVQSGLVGEGWSLTAGGFIESTFRACAEDNDHPQEWFSIWDTCERLENYQLAWGARSGELVPVGDGTRNLWVSANDDGLKAEMVTSVPADARPYWKVTTADGTQWFFGRQRLPGWTAGARETNSTLSQQVWANDDTEPCYNSGSFYDSHCSRVYRWQLDYVVDIHGNSMSYWYERFTNLHGSNGNGWNEKSYDRDGVLKRIEYGTRAGNETNVTNPPAMVEFDNADRCLTDCGNLANWVDTPWDLQCAAPPCQRWNWNHTATVEITGPTYWTHKRLGKVTTKVSTGGGGYKKVDEWALGHSFTGGTDVPVLWLDSVTRTGFDASGVGTSLPPLTTHGFTANNRADYDPDAHMAEPVKTRIDYIDTETGGRIGVTYLPINQPGDPCTWRVNKPDAEWPNYNHNTARCFQQFTANRAAPPEYSWWHKFVVSKVTETDQVGGSDPVETSYTYSMEGAGSPSGHPLVLWSYASNPWGTINKTMSMWRGYPMVITSVGPVGGVQTRTKRLYYRGLDRDTGLDANQGQEFWRRATITDSTGVTVDDHQALAGRVREETAYNGPAEADAISRKIHDFSVTQTQGGGLPSWQTPPERKAYRAREISTKTKIKISGGSWRTTEAQSTWDEWGNRSTFNDLGDIAVGSPSDERCTRYEYARNTNDLVLRAGTGAGLVGQATAATSAAGDLSAYNLLFPVGDFTGDGKKDLLARNGLNTHLHVLAGNGNGTFAAPTRVGISWGSGAYVFSPGDFSGDGKPDVLYRNESNLNLYMIRGNGTGGWVTGTSEQIGAGWIDQAFFSPGDITGDGKADVMFRKASDGKLMFIRGNGASGWINGANEVADAGNWQDRDMIFGWGDATGDGKTDIYARVTATGELKLYPGNGNGTFAAAVSLGTGWNDYTRLATVGDANADGKADMLAVQSGGYLPGATRRVSTVGVGCAATPVYPADFVSDVRTFHDDRAYGLPAVRGLATRTETVKSLSGQNPSGFVVTTAGYDQWGRPVWAKDPLNYQTSLQYTHDAGGLLSSVKRTNPKLHDTTTTLDTLRGLPLTVTDANNKVTTAAYDRLGRMTKVWAPGHATSGTPDAEYVYSITKTATPYIATKALGPNGNQITSYEIFDGFLRPRQTQSVTEAGKRFIVDTKYDNRGLAARTSKFGETDSGPASQLAPVSDVDVEVQNRFEYDWAGRRTKDELWKFNAFQWRTDTVYDGDRVGVIPPSGGTPTQDIFDARGRVVEKRQYSTSPFTGAFIKTTYGYDDAGRMTSMKDPANNTWTYEYDLLGRRTKTIDPDAGTTIDTYDDAGQLQSTKDARNQTLWFEYDSLGRKIKERDTDGSGTTLAEWKYDTAFKGQLDESIRYVGADAYKSRITDRDEGYRPEHTEVVIPNAALNGSLADTYAWDSTYKPNGAPATAVLPGVGGLPAETLTHTYDANGFAQTMVGTWAGGGSQTYLYDISYHYDGLINRKYLGEAGSRVYIETNFNSAGRRMSSMNINTETLGTPDQYGINEFSFSYDYTSSGLIKGIAGSTNEVADQKECFSHDYLGRLREAWTETNSCTTPQRAGADPYWRQWTFDDLGNRLTQTDKDPVAGDTTWTYTVGSAGSVKPHQLKTVTASGPRADAATRTFGYDAAGNTTSAVTTTGAAQTLTWDKEGHLATVVEGANTSSYLYDADGNRLIVRTASKTTLYLPDGTELELPSVGAALGTRYYSGVAVRSAAGVRWTIDNHQGTSTIQIDSVTLAASRRRSMPYGEDRTSTPAGWLGTKGYVGGTKDTNNYTHLGAREYDPTLGRFLSRDPVVDTNDPQQTHGYAYSHNSPVTFSDPSGLIDTCDNDGNTTCPSQPPPNEIPIPDGTYEPDPSNPTPGGGGGPTDSDGDSSGSAGDARCDDDPGCDGGNDYSINCPAGAGPGCKPIADELRLIFDGVKQHLRKIFGPLWEEIATHVWGLFLAMLMLTISTMVFVYRHLWATLKICLVICVVNLYYQHGHFDWQGIAAGNGGIEDWRELIRPWKGNWKDIVTRLKIKVSAFLAVGWTTTEYKDRGKLDFEVCAFDGWGACYQTGRRTDESRWHAVAIGAGAGWSIDWDDD